MIAFSQTKLWDVDVGNLYFVISFVPFYGKSTASLTSEKLSSVFICNAYSFSQVSCFFVLHVLYNTTVVFVEVVHRSCGSRLFTMFVSSGEMIGQV